MRPSETSLPAIRLGDRILGLTTAGATLSALPVVFGMRHWVLDNATSFALHILVALSALTAIAYARRRRRSALLGTAAAIAVAVRVLPHADAAKARTSRPAISWLVANVHTANVHHDALIGLIRERTPHVIGLVETDSTWLRALDRPLRHYRHRLLIPRSDNFGMALYSRVPLSDVREHAFGVVPTIVASLAVAGRELDLVLVHVLPPISPLYARYRDGQLRRIAQLRPRHGGGLVLAGDFNATPFSPTFRATFASAFTRAGGVAGTFPAAWPAALRIPIDHALAAGSVSVRRTIERDIRSDHLPFTVHIDIR